MDEAVEVSGETGIGGENLPLNTGGHNPVRDLAEIVGSDQSVCISNEHDSGIEDHFSFRTRFSIRNHHVGSSLSFNQDKNEIHKDSEAAKLLLLSFASTGKFEKDQVDSEDPAMVMSAVGERIMGQPGIVIAPGIWLSSLFDRYFSFPKSTFPPVRPGFDVEPSLAPECIVTYTSSRYRYPLLVPIEGSKDISLEFKVSKAAVPDGAKDIGMMNVEFAIYAASLFGVNSEVQSTLLHVFPKGTDPKEIMQHYDDKSARKLAGLNVVYSKNGKNPSAAIGGKPSIHTTSYQTSVSGDDYCNFGASIGREDLGDKCAVVTPLALQAKIPRVLFMAVRELADNEVYLAALRESMDCEAEAYREKSVRHYLSMCPESQRDVKAAMALQQKIYMGQETFYNPMAAVRLDDKFSLSVTLEKVRKGIHYFVSEAKTGSWWRGLRGGERIMIGRTSIGTAPQMTERLVEYLRSHRRDMNLDRF